ncbi:MULTISPECIES: hypothetical protein [Asticcacaulis]|uniref:hypothetical protein n=1 Tax=Asticcacaulis TaxID=76890 RepID=UPI001AEB082D|nr:MULTISPECIES: hypothetical protein [Asticcacaulis]MBP2157823.1 hypothetical protein [Asticcacaulis solisilvae]MDR6798868.1 hypothetical protein [Asticcacaulis sp. BE141]
MTNSKDRAFKVRLQAATLEKVIDFRQAHGLPAGEVIGLWARLLTLAEALEQAEGGRVTEA